MKKPLILIVFLTIFTNSSVYSATGDVLSSFSAPSAGTTGVTFDGTYLWTIDTLNREFVQLTKTGTKITSFSIPAEIVSPVDLTYDGSFLWVTDKTSDKIFQLSTVGLVLSFFLCPCTQPLGLAFDGTYFLVGSEPDEIVQVTTSGTLVKSMVSPVRVPQGLTYANDLIWISGLITDNIHATTIYGGLSVYSFPEPDANTQGLGFDGISLWAAGSITDKIYELELNPIMIIPVLSHFELTILLIVFGLLLGIYSQLKVLSKVH
ncbi:MAG: hypothetical protein A2161_04480 [Candidatus Schekmanbacteria bacterium RBG_13_48_7]|uniref:Uncharacterized protein n=1 Tax=Candidatus Schekmanbacteria bacterium RBG_13_48_7 TaxID=1817878 RepID=A0A1F7RUR2_9BACT|nr:MAG: hypothetical protein A2161_04480 [Candidatus Schekmanbacteria bacterium RBG_13_48_7]